MIVVHVIALFMVFLALTGQAVATVKIASGRPTAMPASALGPSWVGLICLAITVVQGVRA